MGFLRGLSPAYMRATPAINDWVAEVVSADAELRGCGFTVLRERAAIGYTGDAFHGLGSRTPYQKMIAALWRESPVPSLAPGERLATMASLLHRDTARTSPCHRHDRGVRPAARGLAAQLSPRLPPAAGALPLPLRPGVHAARREPRDGSARPRSGADVHEGHRRGGRRHGRASAAPRGRADPGHRDLGSAGAGDPHRRLRRVPALPCGHPRRGRGADRGGVLGRGRASASTSTQPTTRSWPTPPRRTTCFSPSSAAAA